MYSINSLKLRKFIRIFCNRSHEEGDNLDLPGEVLGSLSGEAEKEGRMAAKNLEKSAGGAAATLTVKDEAIAKKRKL
jgi:hypothetical protein